MDELLYKVKQNLILEHCADDALIRSFITAAMVELQIVTAENENTQKYQHEHRQNDYPEAAIIQNPDLLTVAETVLMFHRRLLELFFIRFRIAAFFPETDSL